MTLTLTHGEAGRTLGVCEPAELAEVRAAELRAAARELGTGTAEIFSQPDGNVSGHRDATERLIRAAVTRWHPSTVVTFPPNGFNGHRDHIAVHHAALAALSDTVDTRVLLITDMAEFAEAARPGFLSPDEINRLRLPATVTCGPVMCSRRSFALWDATRPRRAVLPNAHGTTPSRSLSSVP